MPPIRVRLVVTLAVLGPAWGIAVAADQKPDDPAADAELLEFLGSVDSVSDSQTADDGSWMDYLARTDIGKVAKTSGSEPVRPKSGPDSTAGEKKND